VVDFFYSNPTWLVGLVVIGICTGVSVLGLIVFHRFVDVHLRHKDTETVGLSYAIVAVIYAVLIAFIVINVFETFSKADEVATGEANKLSNLMLDSAGLPPELGAKIRADLDSYIDIVTKKEWPSQQAGHTEESVFEAGWASLANLSTQLAAFEPTTTGQTINKAEMLRVTNELVKARRGRVIAAGEHVPDVVWQILLLAGAVAGPDATPGPSAGAPGGNGPAAGPAAGPMAGPGVAAGASVGAACERWWRPAPGMALLRGALLTAGNEGEAGRDVGGGRGERARFSPRGWALGKRSQGLTKSPPDRLLVHRSGNPASSQRFNCPNRPRHNPFWPTGPA